MQKTSHDENNNGYQSAEELGNSNNYTHIPQSQPVSASRVSSPSSSNADQQQKQDAQERIYQPYSTPWQYKYSQKTPQYDRFRDHKNRRLYPWLDHGTNAEKKLNALDFFGIFPELPTINIMKASALIILVILVELVVIVSIESSEFLSEFLSINQGNSHDIQMTGLLGAIGIFLGFFYRYIKFEFYQFKSLEYQQQKIEYKHYFKLIFLVLIFIFIIFEIVFELIFARGQSIILDFISILVMTYGSYVIFSGKSYLLVLPMLLIIFLMMISIGQVKPDLVMMTVIGVLTILYLELSDGACRIQMNILKYKDMIENSQRNERAQLNRNIEAVSVGFLKTLGLFMALTIAITGLALLLYLNYRYIVPSFMSENLELHTIYGFLPIIFVIVVIFMCLYLYSKHHTSKLKDSIKLPHTEQYI